MGVIHAKAIDLSGNEVDVKYEAPKEIGPDGQERTALAYLKPSGKTYVNPMYAFAKFVGAPDESIRAAHRGVDGKGNDYVSDQRWIYDAQEFADLMKTSPDRVVRVV